MTAEERYDLKFTPPRESETAAAFVARSRELDDLRGLFAPTAVQLAARARAGRVERNGRG